MNTHLQTRRKVRLVCLVVGMIGLFSAPAAAAGPVLHGWVFGHDEQGEFIGMVPNATIEFKYQSGAVLQTVVSDARAYYKVDLPPGTYYYKVTAEGYKDEDEGRGVRKKHSDKPEWYNFALTKGENDPNHEPPELPVTKVGKLCGQVLERTAKGDVGTPDAVITLNRDGTANPIQVISGPGDANGENVGYYEVFLEEGTWHASVAATGFERFVDPDPITIVADQDTERDFVLSRPEPDLEAEQGIEGVVRLIGAEEPLPEASLRFIRLPGRHQIAAQGISAWESSSTSGARGSEYKQPLPVGRYLVVAQAEGCGLARRVAHVFRDRNSRVDLTLRRLEDVIVNVVTPDNEPVEDALVRLSCGPVRLQRRSEANGQASFNNCPIGKFKALAKKEGCHQVEPIPVLVQVGPGQPNMATLVLANKTDEPHVQPQALTVVVYDAKTTESLVADVRFSAAAVRRTNDEGELQVTCEDEGPHKLVVTCEGYRTHTQALTISPRQEFVRVPMETIPGGKVLVTVTDSSKGPVPGAMVLLRYDGAASLSKMPRKATDSQGRTEFSAEKSGDYTVVAKFGKHPASGKQIHLDPGETEEVHIRLGNPTPPPQPAWGDVLIQVVESGQQNAVQDATVWIHTPGQPQDFSGKPDRTDGQGFGRVRAKPGNHTVAGKASGYEITSTNVSVTPGGETKVTLYAKRIPGPPVTEPPVTVQGYVVYKNPDSSTGYSGIPDTQLVWKRADRPDAPRSTTSASRGHYSITADPGVYRATVVPPADSRFERMIEEDVRVARNMGDKYFILERDEQPEPVRTRTLTVGALNQSGNGIPRATITVRRGNEVVQRSTDGNGYCRFQLAPGTYSIKASAEGYGSGGTTATLSSADVTRVIRLTETRRPEPERTYTVAIDVRDTRSGARVNADNVTWEQSGRRGSAQRYGDGTHRITLPQGNYVFRGYAKGYTVESSKRSIRQSHTVTLRAQPDDQRLPKPATLTVRTYQARGSQRIPVRATINVTGNGRAARGTTDGNGQFRTPPLGPGTYRITASASGFRTGHAAVTVGSRDVTTQIALVGGDPDGGSGSHNGGRSQSSTLTVRTYQTRGNQQIPVRATINVTGNGGAARGTTDGNGYFRTPPLRPGSYRITASASGFRTGHAAVTIGSQDVTKGIALVGGDPDGGSGSHNGGRSQSSTLTVRTHQSRGSQRIPVRATINVTRQGSRVAGGTTDGNGQFRTSLRPGTYHVTASASGFATGRAVVTVRSRPVTAQIALAGGDPDGGRPSHNGGRSPSSKHKRTPSSKQPPSTHQLKAFQLRPMKAASGPH